MPVDGRGKCAPPKRRAASPPCPLMDGSREEFTAIRVTIFMYLEQPVAAIGTSILILFEVYI